MDERLLLCCGVVMASLALGLIAGCPDTTPADDLCDSVTCDDGESCVDGDCVPDDPCADVTCEDGQSCVDGACVPDDPCADVTCDDGESCVDGVCMILDACADVTCGDCEECVDGVCGPLAGDAGAGETFYADNGCAVCHGDGAEGGIGPSLLDAGCSTILDILSIAELIHTGGTVDGVTEQDAADLAAWLASL